MKKTIVTTIAAVAMLTAGAASAGCKTCEIDFNIYNSSQTTIAQAGGGAYKSYIWTCLSGSGATKIVYDQSRNENIPQGTTEIFVYPWAPMHPLSLEFEVEVEKLCSDILGEQAVIADRRELVPAFDDMPLQPWEIEEEVVSEE